MSARALVAAAALCAMAVSAKAADQSTAAGRDSYFPSTYAPGAVIWTGPYFGLHLGGIWTSATWTDPFSGGTDNPRPAGTPLGAQFGVNWQMDQWVFGVEADASWLKLDAADQDQFAFDHRISAHWVATATGRVGYAFNRFLVYFKGGAAFTGERNDVNTESAFNAVATIASTGTLTQVGAAFGGGVDYAFSANWSARLEYLFIDFPSHDLTLHDVANGLPNMPATVDWKMNQVLAGLNFRF
jgi:outer membrane immunogenic protein